MWFAFKLVSLNHWKQRENTAQVNLLVVICFQISIFEPLETTWPWRLETSALLWFAFKLVSLNHWKQPSPKAICAPLVVICFQISIFEPLETTFYPEGCERNGVVICFQISIFEPLETTAHKKVNVVVELWFAFKLVSLNHWKQRTVGRSHGADGCDLLSN